MVKGEGWEGGGGSYGWVGVFGWLRVVVVGRGVVDVGVELMCCSISVGTVCGVTFSMMLKDGRRRMVVGSDDEWWSCGGGMFEAESINFWNLASGFCTPNDLPEWMMTHPVCRLDSTVPDGFHNAALLIRNISDPVSLAGRHQHVGRPAIYMSVQLLVLVDLEIGRVFDGAAFTVMVTVLAVDGWVDSGKEASLGCFGEAVM